MNLIEIQDDLKDLPQSPQTMQALMQYANGANPEVPPYLALAELNRRKQMQQRAQQAQAPQGTVKDAIAQQMGIMSLQQGRQQQMQQQMMQAAQQQQQVPPQVQQQVAQQGPVQAARGGLLSRLMGHPAMRNIRRYNSGGIISFAEGDSVEDRIREMAGAQERTADYGVTGAAPSASSEDLFKAVNQMLGANMNVQRDETPRETRERLRREDPERYAILNKPIGETAMENLRALQEAQRAENERRREEAAQARPGVLQLLSQAAGQTRGLRGTEALAQILGGYGQLSRQARADEVKGEQALRAKELEMMQARFELQGKVEDLQRARADGDVKAENEALAKIKETARKYGMDVAKVLSETAGRVSTSEYYKANEAGSAEQRAETKRSNLAKEAYDAQRLGIESRKLDEGKQAQIALKIEELINKDDLYKFNALQAQALALKEKRTPAEETQLAAFRKNMQDIRERYELAAKRQGGAAPQQSTVTGAPMPTGSSEAEIARKLQVGTVYQTARGPAKWDGSKFIPQ